MADTLPEVPGGPHRRTIAMPREANAGRDIVGGWTLSQMDLAHGGFAAGRAQGRVATVAIEAMRFLRPMAVGDEVSCYCSPVRAGDTSVAAEIETWARGRGHASAPENQRRRTNAPEKGTEGVFTFVPINAEGHPRPLPEAD
jgi:acyl-CoA thioesterase YciA